MAIQQTNIYFLSVFVLLIGCKSAQQIRDPEYAQVSQSVHQASYSPTLDALSPVVADLEGPHSVEEYIQYALDQNPNIQSARKQMEAFAHQVPVAASLQDPNLGMTFYPEQVQTAAGPQEFALSVSQKFPGKLDTRAEFAESQTNVARAQLAAAELETISKVKRAYYELYFIQQTIQVTEADQKLLVEIRDVANIRYKTGKVSQQDLLRAEVEISNVESELIRLRQKLESGQARLARLLHISPQTKVLALDHVTPEEIPQDLGWLQRQAIASRPELHAQLASLNYCRY